MEFRLLGPLEVVEHDRVLELGSAQPARAAGGAAAARERGRLDRPPDRRALGRVAAGDGGQDRPGLRLAAAQGAGRRPAASRARPAMSCASTAPSSTSHASSGWSPRRDRRIRGARRAKLREALALWRGPPLADLAYEPFAQAEIVRLEELRLGGARAAHRRRPGRRPARGADRRARGADRRAPAARAPARPADARALPLRPPGRGARGLPARAARAVGASSGSSRARSCRRLEQAILQQDPALDLPEAGPPASGSRAGGRSLLVVARGLGGRCARSRSPRRWRPRPPRRAGHRRDRGGGRGRRRDGGARRAPRASCAAAASPRGPRRSPRRRRARDVVRLAAREGVDLLLVDAPRDGSAARPAWSSSEAPCDVAMLVAGGGTLRAGPVLVPFGAAWHDWAALELGRAGSRAPPARRCA